MIYDTFCFFNELEILEMRLNILDEVVDYFVICESSVTHTGEDKPFYFEENKALFEKFLPKIIHLKVFDTPNDFVNLPPSSDSEVLRIYSFIDETRCFNRQNEVEYGRDFFQKESVRRGLLDCDDDDIILFSDCDEIPNPTILENLSCNPGEIISLEQKMYLYYLNVLKQTDWLGTRIVKYGDVKKMSLNDIRAKKHRVLANGGWHFSYMGGVERVKTKIKSFSAQELVNEKVLNSVEINIQNNTDPFFRGQMNTVSIDDSFPKFILKNVDRYEKMIKKA